MHYLQSHVQELPLSVIQTLEYIQSGQQQTLCPPAPYRRSHQLSRHDYRHFRPAAAAEWELYSGGGGGGGGGGAYSGGRETLRSSDTLPSAPGQGQGWGGGGWGEELLAEAAARIQLWFRCALSVSSFRIMKNEYFCSRGSVVRGLAAAGLGDLAAAPSRGVRRALSVFLISELKHLRRRRQHEAGVTRRMVRALVLEVAEAALLACTRSQIADLRQRDSESVAARLSAEGEAGQGQGKQGAFSRFAGGFGSLLGQGRKADPWAGAGAGAGEAGDDSENSGEDEDGEPRPAAGVSVRVASTDKNFASRLFKFR
jgi:hypothetical protein